MSSSIEAVILPTTPDSPTTRDNGVVGICDADLVERALKGDVRAEDALFRRHGRYVGGLIARLMGNTQDADDILHDAFFSAFQELERLKKPKMFRAWVTQIAINRVRALLRRRRIERRLGLFAGDEDASLERLVSPGASVEVKSELSRIDERLRRLPVKLRIIWMLRLVEGYSFEEIAALCRCSTATAKRRFGRANQSIQLHVKGGGS